MPAGCNSIRFPRVAAAAHHGWPVREVKSPVLSFNRISTRGIFTAAVDEALDDNAGLRDELDGLARARRRADAESTADEKLAALKRRMGK